jgi:fructose-1,6-bisphosphatase I
MAAFFLSPRAALIAALMLSTHCSNAFVSVATQGATAPRVAPLQYVVDEHATTEPPTSSSRSFVKPVVNHNYDVCPQTGLTLSRYMMEMEQLNPELSQVESIFTSIQVACKAISKLCRTAALKGFTGVAHGGGSINVQGEEQKQMDVLANDCLKSALKWAGSFKTIASEEEEEPLTHEGYTHYELVEKQGSHKYIAVFDPLDGSSNIDAGIPVGTIFGIFQHSEECSMDSTTISKNCKEDILQPGHNLVAAGYCLYSSATTLVFTLGDGTHGFTLDESLGEFVLTHPNMKIPDRGQIYSANEGNRWDWDESMQEYITNLQQGKGETGKRYSGRYVGSMVADVHRTLQFGGIFAYPADKKNVNGKLRLMYEAAPMAFLVEQAGGLGTTGTQDIMDVQPTDVHARVPCILGSKDDVKELQSYYQKPKPANGDLEGVVQGYFA